MNDLTLFLTLIFITITALIPKEINDNIQFEDNSYIGNIEELRKETNEMKTQPKP